MRGYQTYHTAARAPAGQECKGVEDRKIETRLLAGQTRVRTQQVHHVQGVDQPHQWPWFRPVMSRRSNMHQEQADKAEQGSKETVGS